MEYKEGTFKMGRCNIIVSIDEGNWHLSISTPTASPSYTEIKAARYMYLPDNIHVAQIFPPKEDFVNFHPYCHHLYQIPKITKKVCPNCDEMCTPIPLGFMCDKCAYDKL